MNTNLLNIVKRIIAEQGEGILADTQRLRAFFMDYSKDEPRQERLAFGRCIELGSYQELKNAHTTDERQHKKVVLADQLHTRTNIDRELCANALDLLETVMFDAAAAEKTASFQPTQATLRATIFCVICGEQLPGRARFCLGCGSSVIPSQPVSSTLSAVPKNSNAKIKGKLFMGFFLVLAITVFIAVFGIVNINTINTNFVLMQDFPSTRYDTLNYMAADIMDLRRIVTAMAFHLGDEPTLNLLRTEAVQLRRVLDGHLDTYDANQHGDIMISTERRAELLAESRNLRELLHRYTDEVLEGMFAAARDGIPGDPESRARIDIYLDTGAYLYDYISDTFNTLRSGAQATMMNRYLEIQATTANTMVIMVILTIVGVILGLLIAMLISGMVTKPRQA